MNSEHPCASLHSARRLSASPEAALAGRSLGTDLRDFGGRSASVSFARRKLLEHLL